VLLQMPSAGPQFAAPGRRHDSHVNGGCDTTPHMLSVLTAEARTVVLAAMPPSQRWRLLEAMRDEERADIVVVMGQGEEVCWSTQGVAQTVCALRAELAFSL
jgi:hypothetical protein